jgi:hypothetical protein
LKLRDVERQIFLADFVEAPDDAALEDAPETFNRVGVKRADNVVALAMIDALMRQTIFGTGAIGAFSSILATSQAVGLRSRCKGGSHFACDRPS